MVVPHCADYIHPLGSTFFVPQLAGRLGDTKLHEPKFFNKGPPLNEDGKSVHCEINKFDDMMALLARENPDFP